MNRTRLRTSSVLLRDLVVAGVALGVAGVPLAASPQDASSPDPPQSIEASGSAGAELHVDERIRDIGEVPFGKRIPVRFELRNDGASVVTVEEVVAVPGLSPALSVEDYPREIPPGEVGVVEVILDTSKMVGKTQSPFRVVLEGAEEPMTLAVAAEVRNHFAASPGSARWLYVHGEPTGTIVQHVWARAGENFEVLEVRSPPQIEVEFRRAGEDELLEDRPEPQWLVAATLRQDAEVGPLEGFLEVLVDHPVQDSLLIPVSGFVRPAMFLSPQEGDFGSVVVDEPKAGLFHLKSFLTDPIQIEKVELVPMTENLEAGYKAIEPGREFQVWVRLLPGIAPGPYEGELRIHTDTEARPVVRAPVRVVVRSPDEPTE